VQPSRVPFSAIVLFALAACAALGAVALLLSPSPDSDPAGRVLVLALDGVDPDAVAAWGADGGLPHLERMAMEGASARLRSEEPLLSPVVWTTVATGRPPHEHGIAHFTAVDPTSGERRPVTSASRRVEAAWNIVSDSGLPVAVVGWWATWPAEEVLGQVVSDRVGYHFLDEESRVGESGRAYATYPPELWRRIAPRMDRARELSTSLLARFVDLSDGDRAPAPGGRPPLPDLSDPVDHLRWAVTTAVAYRDVALDLWREDRPRLEMVYVEATDTASHLYGADARLQQPHGTSDPDHRTVEQIYRFADEIVGAFLAAADRHTTVIVLSDHGFALGQPPPVQGVSHRQHRPDGILRMWGRGVRTGARLRGATVYDVLPTILALLDLPAAEDMPGRVLSPALTLGPPPLRVASYEDPVSGDERRASQLRSSTDRALLEHLAALGYTSGPPRADERRLAAIAYRQGRYAAAERLYRRLLAEHPEEAALHASLGGVLAQLGRYEEARTALERALDLDTEQPEARHNLTALQRRVNEE